MDVFNDPHAAIYTRKPRRSRKNIVVAVSVLAALILAAAIAWVL